MLIEGISPIIFSVGPLEFRWYGLMVALSFLIGSYIFIKYGKKKGIPEEILLTAIIAILLGGVMGARAIFVLTNISYFMDNPAEIIRVDQGGLAFHGALLGGFLGGWLIIRLNRLHLHHILDLTVPGIAIGYMLVRTANIFNQELLGRPAELLAFDRHPAQVYGILIGATMLLLHLYLSRKYSFRNGVLFWSFIMYYSLLRGAIEETFRQNPLYLWGYVSEAWGAGFFTLTQLATPPLILFAWWMRNRAIKSAGLETDRFHKKEKGKNQGKNRKKTKSKKSSASSRKKSK